MSTLMLMNNFPKPLLSIIATHDVPPTFLSLEVAQRELNANASSIHSNSGGGRNGHLALTMTPEAYLLRTGHTFLVPDAPSRVPVYPTDTPTAAQITETNRQLLADQKVFSQYYDTDKALVRQLLDAVPGIYIERLNDRTYGFSNVSCLQLLSYLKSEYGKISIADMAENAVRMSAPWQPPVPIQSLFKQLEDGTFFAAAGLEPISDHQVARLGYSIVLATGLFPEGCREWRLKPAPSRTYDAFRTFFRLVDSDRREAHTSSSVGYSGTANSLVLRPGPVSSIPELLPDAPSTSVHPGQYSLLLQEVQTLKFQLAAALQVSAPQHQRPVHPPTPTPPTRIYYCWTHGFGSDPEHTGHTCRNQAPGHQPGATAHNQLGGSARHRGTNRYRPLTPPS